MQHWSAILMVSTPVIHGLLLIYRPGGWKAELAWLADHSGLFTQ